MARRSRTRRVLKLVGITTCVLLIVSWGVSLGLGLLVRFSPMPYQCLIANGRVSFTHIVDYQMLNSSFFPGRLQAFHADGSSLNPGDPSWYKFGTLFPRGYSLPGIMRGYTVPHWLLLVFAGVPTVWLFWRDRPSPVRGHCQRCGYDLTGNVSGVCPECGMPIRQSDAR